ncbi:MAG: peptidase S11, partial [Comamonadaceae bacterium]
MHARPGIAARFVHALAFVTLSLALASPTAPAAERKKTVVKKQASSVTAKRPAASAANKVSRKAVTRVKATRVAARSARAPVRAAAIVPERLSFGQLAGLHSVTDPLDLKSSVALVIDQETNEVLLSKNDHAVLPIASLTKLMTGLLISQARTAAFFGIHII